MIWLTWRQFRLPAIVALGALAVVAVILAITGPHIADIFHTSVTTCTVIARPRGVFSLAMTSRYRTA